MTVMRLAFCSGNIQVVADEFEKRLIVVAVGYRESCDDSHHQENAAGMP